MRTLSESAKIAMGLVPGRKNYKELYNEELHERVVQEQQFERTMKVAETTKRGTELALQQIAKLNKQFSETQMKALPPANGEDE